MLTSYTKCDCGAITVYTVNGASYSFLPRNRKKYLPALDLRKLKKCPDTFCCDHCVNHYGLDLCACGSGEPVGKCTNGLEMCNTPMQIFQGRSRYSSAGAWIA